MTTPDGPTPPTLLIVCTDLIFSTKITGTAKALGRAFMVARTLPRLQELLAAAADPAVADGAPLLIVDLNASGIDPIEAIKIAKAQAVSPRVIAFLSHVQVELAAAAKAAGADQVLPRSAFTAQLPTLIAGA